MSEGLRIRDAVTRPRVVAAALLASVAFAGCGVTKSADKVPVGTCGSHDYSEAWTVVHDKAQVLATAKQDVLALQQLALRVGGSIDLTRYGGNQSGQNVKEVTASEDNLRLNFDRSGNLFTDPRVDHVDFPISGDVVHVSEGALMCINNDTHQLVVNGTYESLQNYVLETAP